MSLGAKPSSGAFPPCFLAHNRVRRPPLLNKLSQPSTAHHSNANDHGTYTTTFYLHTCLCVDAHSKAPQIRRDSGSRLRSQYSAVVTGSQGYPRLHGWVFPLGMGSSKRANNDTRLRMNVSRLHARDRSANLSVVSTQSHYQLNPTTTLLR